MSDFTLLAHNTRHVLDLWCPHLASTRERTLIQSEEAECAEFMVFTCRGRELDLFPCLASCHKMQGTEEAALTGTWKKEAALTGTKPSNWQGCCKLVLGGGKNHLRCWQPHLSHSPLAAQDCPVMDKVSCMFV